MTDENKEILSEEQLKKEINNIENQEKKNTRAIRTCLGICAFYWTIATGFFIASASVDITPIPTDPKGEEKIAYKSNDKACYGVVGGMAVAMGLTYGLCSVLPIEWNRSGRTQKQHYQALLEQAKTPER